MEAKVKIKKCIEKVRELITPLEDDQNEHKQAQLRELAQINGTLRDRHLLDEDMRRGGFGREGVRINNKPNHVGRGSVKCGLIHI